MYKRLTVQRRDGGMQLLEMLLLRVHGDWNGRRRCALRVTHRSRRSLIELRCAVDFLVIAISSAADARLCAATVRVRGSPLRLLNGLTVAVVQARFVGPQALLRWLTYPRAVDSVTSLVVGHRTLARHRDVRRDRALPVVWIRRWSRVLVRAVR